MNVADLFPPMDPARREEIQRDVEAFGVLVLAIGQSSRITLARSTASGLGIFSRREAIRRAARARKARRGW